MLRLVAPLAIFRWPLLGGVVALLLDLNDGNIARLIGAGGISSPLLDGLFNSHYQQFDKILDTYYLSFEVLVSLRWRDKLARTSSIWLFIWRLIGVAAFELTKLGWVLVVFPNLFEWFFLSRLAIVKYRPRFVFTAKTLLLLLLLLLPLKLYQEYMLHILNAQPYIDFKHWLHQYFP